MFIRHVTTRRGDKTYRYPQLVESFRRANGTPSHRVLSSLGHLTELELQNLQRALAASREGVPVEPRTRKGPVPVVKENRRYLDVAAVLRAWNDLGLPAVLRGVLPAADTDVPHADVIAALAVHRCIAPGSKLTATRWYPTTALPLLLGVAPGAFNNTRVHRALAALSAARERLQEELPSRILPEDGSFVALFLDATDTWFEGRGPPMAEKGRDKEGIYRRRIGLALLCDPRGYPVRWRVLPGRFRESPVMEEICAELSAASWVGATPVVMDRAMGRAGSVEFLATSGLRYLTALASDEFVSYTARIPEVPADTVANVEALGAWALGKGFTHVRGDRYVLDLGVVDKGEGDAEKGRRHRVEVLPMTVAAVQRARVVRAEMEAGETCRTLAHRQGITQAGLRRYLLPLRLTPELQERVLAGELAAGTLGELLRIGDLPAGDQASAFDGLKASLVEKAPRRAHAAHVTEPPAPIRIRLVVLFNPERLVEQRRAADANLDVVRAMVDEINAHLGKPRTARSIRAVERELDVLIARKKLLDVVKVRVHARADGKADRVEIEIDEVASARQHRYDGFNVFVADPRLQHSAADLVALYFQKDAVERDFHTIKSEVEIRPVRHRTNPKVHGHVDLCVLALLTERAMEARARKGGTAMSAPAALEQLATCHLNEIAVGKTVTQHITELTAAQRHILHTLGMDDLADLPTEWKNGPL